MIAPIFTMTYRALVADSRSMGPYLRRIALLLLTFIVVFSAHESSSMYSAPGLIFFAYLAWVDLLLITVICISTFSSAIATEREQGSLGMLKMTGLSPISILLGLSLAPLVEIVLLLLLQVPFTLLAITLGGISIYQITATYVMLVAYIVMLFGLGLLISCLPGQLGGAWSSALDWLGRVPVIKWFWRLIMMVTAFVPMLLALMPRSRTSVATAGARMFGMLALYAVGPFVMVGIAYALESSRIGWISSSTRNWVESQMMAIAHTEPYWMLTEILGTNYTQPIFRTGVWAHLVAGGVFFLLAWLGFERLTRESASEAGTRKIPRKAKAQMKAAAAAAAAHQPEAADTATASPAEPAADAPVSVVFEPVAWKNPLAWKDFNLIGGGKKGMGIRFSVYCLIVGAIAALTGLNDIDELGAVAFWIGWTGGMLELASIVATVFSSEIKGRTLATLRMLPIPFSRQAYSKLFGSMISLLPALSLMAFGTLVNLHEVDNILDDILTEVVGWYMITQFILGYHLVALLSIRLLNPILAIGASVICVAILNFLLAMMMALGMRSGPSEGLLAMATFFELGACAFSHPLLLAGLEKRAAD